MCTIQFDTLTPRTYAVLRLFIRTSISLIELSTTIEASLTRSIDQPTMATFALGLTKTAVDRTLSKAKLKESVQHDLVFITDEFQTVRAFLSVANKEHARNDEVAKTCMRQLRDLAFDVEDCVEFFIHLDKKMVLGWFWRSLLDYISPRSHLDQAANEINNLKTRA